ncbi:MAG: hypothetical protein KF817_02205 [Phycisphaeraceae bacterium]|nr:hypothetical protein [Phycisphaeraceae bacterium]
MRRGRLRTRRCAGGARAALAAAVLVPVALLPACNLVAPIAYIVDGPPKQDAEFILPPKTTVVFVDDRRNIVRFNARAVRQALADAISQELLDRKILTEVIRPRDAMNLASAQDRHGGLIPLEQIAREVGAEVMIFIEMTAFTESPDGSSYQPMAACNVRVLDVAGRAWLFPPPDSLEPARVVQTRLPEADPTLQRSATTRMRVHESLAKELGLDVVKLFYRHEIRELGRRLGPR